jgi:DNA-binding NarL/FixJ family response regulator
MIADDHPIVRRGLRNIVESEKDLQVVAEAENAAEVLERAARTQCDVVVLDLAMPGANGLSVLKELRRQHPRIAVLVLSVAPEEQFALRAVKAGAAGYLTKRSAPNQLVDAIRCLLNGRLHLSVATGRSLVNEAMRPNPRRSERWTRLSDRELEILRLLAAGLSPTRIGQALGISVKTVSTHRRRLMTKLDIDSTAGLVRYAITEGLIEG